MLQSTKKGTNTIPFSEIIGRQTASKETLTLVWQFDNNLFWVELLLSKEESNTQLWFHK